MCVQSVYCKLQVANTNAQHELDLLNILLVCCIQQTWDPSIFDGTFAYMLLSLMSLLCHFIVHLRQADMYSVLCRQELDCCYATTISPLHMRRDV